MSAKKPTTRNAAKPMAKKATSKKTPAKKPARKRPGETRAQSARPEGGARAAVRDVAVALDSDIDNLAKIDHIVVLMMENRSFDQMLGYLSLVKNRSDVDGLQPGMSNPYDGKVYPIQRMTDTKLRWYQDPCHDGACVAEQLANNNSGFVSNYAKEHQHPNDVANAGLVMGYFDQTSVPTYDLLAEEFTICDQWYASVAGATWPNRLYAVAGKADKSKNNPTGIPRYYLESFVRHLDARQVSWKWYGYPLLNPFGGILTTIQMADDKYNATTAGDYAFCDPHFFDDAANGNLAAVSWIDPNFGYPFHGPYENDDHPPADIVAGQDLALRVYHAVTQGPLRDKTLLVIVYDEHGGFHDHQHPTVTPQDDDPNFREYGARVPAFVVSPWAERRYVAKDCYDHTSIIKTILLRFCLSGGRIPDMGARVNGAKHLGGLLSQQQPRPAPTLADHQAVVERIAEWRAQEVRSTFQESRVAVHDVPHLNEFQKGLEKAAASLAAREKKRAAPKKRPAAKRPKAR